MAPVISFNESKVAAFPVYDFNGQPASSNLTALQTPLQLGNEGHWMVMGISATLCTSASTIADGTNINIQIRDIDENKDFFTYTQAYALTGAPIEHVAGKYGNPRWFNYPRILKPGTRLVLYASHQANGTPNLRSPMYVCLHLVLTKDPIPNLVLGSFQSQVEDNAGIPFELTTKFVLSGAAANNLLPGMTRSQQSPMNRDLDFYLNSITARSTFLTTAYINTVDPRYAETELLCSFRDSLAQSPFVSPNPVPLSLIAGIAGAREYQPPTFFHVNPNADLVTTLVNKTGATTINTDVELTLQGAVLKSRQ